MWGGVSPSLSSSLATGTTESAGFSHQKTAESPETKCQKTNSAELFAELAPPTVAGSASIDAARLLTRALWDDNQDAPPSLSALYTYCERKIKPRASGRCN
jgi:hypothetical protein